MTRPLVCRVRAREQIRVRDSKFSIISVAAGTLFDGRVYTVDGRPTRI